MSTLKKALPVLLIIASLFTIVLAVSSQLAFDNTGSVAVIEVQGFLEASCVTPLSLIEWPPLEPGENATTVIYVNSTSTIPAVLNLTTTDWIPPLAESYVSLTWNLEGVTILPNWIMEATLTLMVDVDVENITTFDFTALINASEE